MRAKNTIIVLINKETYTHIIAHYVFWEKLLLLLPLSLFGALLLLRVFPGKQLSLLYQFFWEYGEGKSPRIFIFCEMGFG